jgi:hypothetical protein
MSAMPELHTQAHKCSVAALKIVVQVQYKGEVADLKTLHLTNGTN